MGFYQFKKRREFQTAHGHTHGSEYNSGQCIYIGVAPSGINKNEDNLNKCGWYVDCFGSTLHSGPHIIIERSNTDQEKKWGDTSVQEVLLVL